MTDIIRRNVYARAEYIGTEYAEAGKCKECGTSTRRWWIFQTYAGRKTNIGYFCGFDCLAGHHGFDADMWNH